MTINNGTTVRKIHDIIIRELDIYLHEAFFKFRELWLYPFSLFQKNSSGRQLIILFNFVKKWKIMVTIIKKGTTKEKIQVLLTQQQVNQIRKSIDLHKYCGKLNLKEDPLKLQKKWRNEWE